MARNFNSIILFMLVAALLLSTAGCATTGPYDASSTSDRYNRFKCEEDAQSDEYRHLRYPKAAFVQRNAEGNLKCKFYSGGRHNAKADVLSEIRSTYPTATLVAFNDDLLTHTQVRSQSSNSGPSWGEILLGGAAQIAAAKAGTTYAAAARAEAAANADRDAWGNSKFNTYQFNNRSATGYSGNSAPSPNTQYAATPPISPIPSLPSNSFGAAPKDSSTKRYFPDANNCVYIDGRSNSLADFIGNRCSFPIAVWYCMRDPGHVFQCGRSSTSAGQLTYIGARDRSTTIKGKHYSWVACGSSAVDVHLFYADAKWDGQHLRGRCHTPYK